MIRLLAPVLLALLGALVGLGIRALLASPHASRLSAAIAGAAGGFAGLWLHDLLDVGGAMPGGLAAAVAGAAVVALPVVWLARGP